MGISSALVSALALGLLAAVLAGALAPGYFVHIPPRADTDGILTFSATHEVADAETGDKTTVWLYDLKAWLVHALVIGLLVALGAFFVVPVVCSKITGGK